MPATLPWLETYRHHRKNNTLHPRLNCKNHRGRKNTTKTKWFRLFGTLVDNSSRRCLQHFSIFAQPTIGTRSAAAEGRLSTFTLGARRRIARSSTHVFSSCTVFAITASDCLFKFAVFTHSTRHWIFTVVRVTGRAFHAFSVQKVRDTVFEIPRQTFVTRSLAR